MMEQQKNEGLTGRIVKGIAGSYYVMSEKAGESACYECKAKGIFRKHGQKPLIGDLVHFSILDPKEHTGIITEILPRKTELIRPAVANVDQVLLVFALKSPDPNRGLIDRFLVNMERQSVPVIMALNKCDLGVEEDRKELLQTYRDQAGYPLVPISVREQTGIDQLCSLLNHKTTVFAGPSGVGKSSLVNLLSPKAGMEIGELSRKIQRGKNTTRHTEIIPCESRCEEGSYLIDTPGFSQVNLDLLELSDLELCFPEFQPHLGGCRFAGCAHIGERKEDCPIKKMVSEGGMSPSRYENYRLFYQEVADRPKY